MPQYDVKLSYVFDDWCKRKIRKVTEIQRHSGRTPDHAAEAAIENLREEHGSSAWDIKVVSVKQIPSKKKPGKKNPQAKRKPISRMTLRELEALEEESQRCVRVPLSYCHGCGDCEKTKKKGRAKKGGK